MRLTAPDWRFQAIAPATSGRQPGRAAWRTALLLIFSSLLLSACAALPPAGSGSQAAAGPDQPYAGLQERPIRALAPDRVADLLAGRGAGYALAAELNGHPGPTHVLALAAELQLTPAQDRAVRDAFAAMQRQAQALGRQLVDLEAELDSAFRAGSLSPDELERRTAEIAAVDGRLRATHLAAHLEMKALLTPDQVARFDRLRGYAAADQPAPANQPPPEHEHSPEHPRPH